MPGTHKPPVALGRNLVLCKSESPFLPPLHSLSAFFAGLPQHFRALWRLQLHLPQLLKTHRQQTIKFALAGQRNWRRLRSLKQKLGHLLGRFALVRRLCNDEAILV